MFKRFAMSVSTLCLFAAGLIVASSPAAGVAGFGDVPESTFYTSAVQWMVDNDITTGTSSTCFSPGDSVTRGQAAAFLWRMEGSPRGSAPHPFVDVVAPWQQEPVSWMYAENITTGTSPTTYSPDAKLTRGQMAALIWRAAENPPAAATTFPDVFKPWQVVPVGWMEAENITTGTSPTTFSPEDPVTRGQFAAFAWRWKEEPPVVVDEYTPLCGGRDDFDSAALQPGWTWNDTLFETYRSLTDYPGYVAMRGSDDGGVELNRAPVAASYLIETKMLHQPNGYFAEAGLQSGNGVDAVTLTRDHCVLAGCAGDAIYFGSYIDGEFVEATYFPIPAEVGEVYLSLFYNSTTALWDGAFSLDGAAWTQVDSFFNRIDDATYGLYSAYAENDPAPTTLFDWFREEAR